MHFEKSNTTKLACLAPDHLVKIKLTDGTEVVGYPDCVIPSQTTKMKYEDAIVINFPEHGGTIVDNSLIASFEVV
ncbi:MAG: hypothetical protein ACOYH4_04255 [Saccharofermentanales bacterium]|jgi:hypothetical protein